MPGVISLNGTYNNKIVPITYDNNDELFYVQIGDNEYIPIEGSDLNKFGIDYKDVAGLLKSNPALPFYYKQSEALVKKYGGVLQTPSGSKQTYANGKKVDFTGQEYISTPYYVNVNGETRPVYLSSSRYDPNGRTYNLVTTDGEGKYTPISNQTYSSLEDLKTKGMPDNINYYNNKITSYNNKMQAEAAAMKEVMDTVINIPNYSADANISVGPVSATPPKLMTAAELAELYGLNYDYDYILNMLNEGTDMYLNEMTEKAKTLQGDTLRNQSALYQQYLDTLRATRANAVNTGINRGALAAQELAQYLLSQQQIGTSQSDFNSQIYNLYNEAITEKAQNKETARKQYNQLGNALMSAAASFNTNDTQRYAADMAAASQIASANATANAETRAAAIQAQNNAYINYLNSYANPQNAWLVDIYKQNAAANNNQMNANAKYYNTQSSK